MVAKVRCRCGQELSLETGKTQVVCPACQRKLRVPDRQHSRDVFLSYSSEDKPAADAACAILERHGIRCWMAPRDIMPGTEWSAAIIEGIEQTRLMVLLYSQHSNQSPQVLREVERAVSKGMSIIPLRLDKIALSKSLEYFISSQHWLDALTPPLERHLDTLADTVRSLLNRVDTTRVSATTGDQTRPDVSHGSLGPTVGTSRKLTLMVLALTAATVLAGSLVYWAMPAADESATASQEQSVAESSHDERDPVYVTEMRRRFAAMDTNSDASVSGVEFLQSARDNELSYKFATERFGTLDADHNHQLSLEEFVALSDGWIDQFDRDNSGKVSLSEFQQLTPYKSKKDGSKQARDAFQRFDLNDDGQLDVREAERLLLVRP